MKGKFIAVLFVIVFVLLIAVVFSLLNDSASPKDIAGYRLQSGQNSEGGLVSAIETPSYASTPAPTFLPLPTQEPTPTPIPVTPAPTPTPPPTPTPAPVNIQVGSGSFESNTGTFLNIVADWTATTISESQVEVKINVRTKSYALEYTGFPNAVHISLGDKFENCAANDVNYDGKALAENELASYTATVSLPAGTSNSFPLQVVWDFNGVMGGAAGPVPLQTIECGGTISISR